MSQDMVPSKVCTQCNQCKPCDQFNKRKAKSDGLQSECRDCHNERCRRYRDERPEEVKKAQKKYRNSDRGRSQNVKNGRRYRSENREKVNERARRRRVENYDRIREREKKSEAARKEKVRDKQLQDLYGITTEEYVFLLKQQDNKCACCGVSQDESSSFNVDHDHSTMEVRGLLCRKCNMGIGLLGDTANSVMAAVLYLQNHTPHTQKLLHDFRTKTEALRFIATVTSSEA